MSDAAVEENHRYSAAELIAFASSVCTELGVPPDDARLLADTLVRANLRGHDSHGLLRLPWYVRRLQSGVMRPVTDLTLEQDSGVVSVFNAHHGLGQVAAFQAMEHAITRAQQFGAALVAVHHSNHFGAAMYYALEAVPRDCIGIVTTNASPGMAPWGGREARVGNNPFSIAAPAGRYSPVCLDMANTVVARGKIYLAQEKGQEIPLGWAMDAGGNPTTDPAAALAGLILPAGGHKGYGLAFMMDVLSGVLTGSNFATGVSGPWQAERASGCGHLMVVLDIKRFLPVDEFKSRVDRLIDEVKSTPLAPGFEEIYYPGELEARQEEFHTREGVSLPERTVVSLRNLARELEVSHPFARGQATQETF